MINLINKKLIVAICVFLIMTMAITGCRPAERPIPEDTRPGVPEPAPAPGQMQEQQIPGETREPLPPGQPIEPRPEDEIDDGTLRNPGQDRVAPPTTPNPTVR